MPGKRPTPGTHFQQLAERLLLQRLHDAQTNSFILKKMLPQRFFQGIHGCKNTGKANFWAFYLTGGLYL
jgi:hypothetical protein